MGEALGVAAVVGFLTYFILLLVVSVDLNDRIDKVTQNIKNECGPLAQVYDLEGRNAVVYTCPKDGNVLRIRNY